MKTETVSLSSICEILSGGTPSKANPDFWKGDIPWVSPKDMKANEIFATEDRISRAAIQCSAARLVPSGSILVVVRSGILSHTLPVATVSRDMAFNQDIKALIPRSNLVDPAYVFWFLRAVAPLVIQQGVKKGATVHSLQGGFLEGLKIPLPTRNEQIRIVNLLSRAEHILRLQHEASKKAQEIIPAIFAEMFGDPTENAKGWPLVSVSDLVSRLEGGKNLQAGGDGDSPYRILKVSAVTSGKYLENESKPAPENYDPPQSYFVRKGDMLFSRANTLELVGATAIVEKTNEKTLLPDKLWRFSWSQAVEPRYMLALFQNTSVRQALGKLSSGTSASMKNISQAKLLSMCLPVAPLERQKAFALQVSRMNSIMNKQLEATHKAKECFLSILSAISYTPFDALNSL